MGFCGNGSENSGPVKEGELLTGRARLRILRHCGVSCPAFVWRN